MSENLEKNDLTRRVPEIDGLRGLAILMVLANHLFGQGINLEQSHPIAVYSAQKSFMGSHGVTIFFIISCYLIGGILLDNRNAKNDFQTYYIRRIFRIFPWYF